jgi:ribosomal protein L7/L12
MSPWEVTLLIIATIGSIAAAAGAWFQERRGSAARMAALNRKLDLVMAHLGIASPEEPEVLHHLANGRTIEAVRAYREQTGATLLEAKQAVDRIAAAHDLPER